jgi:6-phosphogluconolactonase
MRALRWVPIAGGSFCSALVALACGGGSGSSAGAGAGGSGVASASSAASTSSSSGKGGAGGQITGAPFAYVGASDGKVRVMSLDKQAGTLSLIQEIDGGANPSFLAVSPDRRALYAVNEGSNELAAFSIDGATGKLTFKNRVSSNGAGPAHIALDATGSYVFGVNYGGGSATMLKRNADDSLGASLLTLATGKNAHEIVFDPSNKYAFVPNLGSDNVSQLVFDANAGTLAFNATPSVALPAGAGPRHMAFHPSSPYAYVIHELDDKVTAFSFDPATGRLAPMQTISTLPGGVDGTKNTCAEIAFGASGRFLYGSNRGDDSIVIYDVDPQSGMMSLVGHQATGGRAPRHFSIEPSGEVLLVGNQQSSNVVTFRLDQSTGKLTKLVTTPLPAGPAFAFVIYL